MFNLVCAVLSNLIGVRAILHQERPHPRTDCSDRPELRVEMQSHSFWLDVSMCYWNEMGVDALGPPGCRARARTEHSPDAPAQST